MSLGPAVPRRFVAYSSFVCAAALAVAIPTLAVAPPLQPWLVVLLVVSAVLAELLAFELPNGTSTSLGFSLTVAATVLMGPAAAGLVAAASGISLSDFRERRPLAIPAFNFGQLILVSISAAWVYVLCGGPVLYAGFTPHPVTVAEMPRFLFAAFASITVATLGNHGLVVMGIHLYTKTPLVEIWNASSRWVIPRQFTLASIGLVIAQVLAVTPLALPLFALPLIIAQQTYRWYMGYREAYADTIKALVGLIEAKDPYTRGHSERVAGYAVELGRRLGLGARVVERLEYAALLHDFGKVGVPASLLTKPGPLTAEEFDIVRTHPKSGADLVAEIPYLKDLSETIASHHERYDGAGYGEGLSGDSIPLAARLLAVADAYDAMTSDRPYRPGLNEDAALEEIRLGAGNQFDPKVAEAFVSGHTQPAKPEGAPL